MKRHRRRRKSRRRNRKNNNIFINLLLLIFVMIFVFSLYKILIWYQENQKSNKIFKKISTDIKISDHDKYDVDFDSLKKKNKDMVAFIRVNGTNIEYPVVKTDNNDYYLTHSFDKSSNEAGWVFANYTNKLDGTDKNITLFAHARRDGSMFGTLYKTLSNDWRKNKKNQKILFMTEQSLDYYQVFSTYKIKSEDYYIMNSFDDEEDYSDFLDKLKNRSNYNYNVDINNKDSILTLSTCASNDRYRIVLHAIKINNNEKTD